MSADIVLNLWKKNLGTIPGDVWNDAGVTVLILADNALTALPRRLDSCRASGRWIWDTIN